MLSLIVLVLLFFVAVVERNGKELAEPQRPMIPGETGITEAARLQAPSNTVMAATADERQAREDKRERERERERERKSWFCLRFGKITTTLFNFPYLTFLFVVEQQSETQTQPQTGTNTHTHTHTHRQAQTDTHRGIEHVV